MSSEECVDGYPSESLVTTVLVEQNGVTTLTTTARYESREVRDAVLKTGMECGVAASYDRLAELLASADTGRKQSDTANALPRANNKLRNASEFDRVPLAPGCLRRLPLF